MRAGSGSGLALGSVVRVRVKVRAGGLDHDLTLSLTLDHDLTLTLALEHGPTLTLTLALDRDLAEANDDQSPGQAVGPGAAAVMNRIIGVAGPRGGSAV